MIANDLDKRDSEEWMFMEIKCPIESSHMSWTLWEGRIIKCKTDQPLEYNLLKGIKSNLIPKFVGC